jgi:predicted Zn-dependent protease
MQIANRTYGEWRLWTLLGVALAGIMVAAVPTGCSVNPATQRRQLSLFSMEQEVELGREAKGQVLGEMGGELADPQLKAYITQVGMILAATTEGTYPQLPWEFTVINSDIINAFALPGGQVFISRGLLLNMTNEAQLAGVLGHEIGHVTARHGNDRMVSSVLYETGAAVSTAILSEGLGGTAGELAPRLVQFGGQTIVLRYGRKEELEADEFGMRYMSRAGYDPTGQRDVMKILEASMGDADGLPPEWLSTHPYPKTRIDRINSMLAGEYAQAAANPTRSNNEAEYNTRVLQRLRALPPAPRTTNAMLMAWAAASQHTGCNGCRVH